MVNGSKGSNLFRENPEMVVSLLVPSLPSETVAYKYLKDLARDFIKRSENPSEFAELVNGELSRETSRTRREALLHLKQRAIEVFALDEG
jgi:hypothetical protein